MLTTSGESETYPLIVIKVEGIMCRALSGTGWILKFMLQQF